MANTRDYMDYLDEHIEIAPANSQEEYQAAETIAEVLRDHDLETTIEEFDAHPMGTYVGPVLACALFVFLLVAGLTEGAVQIIMILLAAVAAGLPLFVHFSGMSLFDNIGPAAQSQNVVAVHRATGDKVVKGARPIVIVAHYDTPRESILRKTPIARYQAAVRMACIPCMIAVAVSLFFQILLFLPGVVRTFMWVIGLLAAVPLLALAIIDIVDHFGSCTVGANDNKSSVAALLAIANKVRPTGDRVDDDFEGEARKPVRRRSTDEPAKPAEPRRIEIVEEVKGVRHGADVLSALGILPATCEVVYQEPRVQIVEQTPTEVLTDSVEEDDLAPVEEPMTETGEQGDEGDLSIPPADSTYEEEDQGLEELPEEGELDEYDEGEEAFNEEYSDDEYADEYEEEEYDEEDYEDDEEWDGPSAFESVGSWLSERIAGIREYFSKDRGSDVDIDRGEDRRDKSDDPDEYDIWIDEYEEDDEDVAPEEDADLDVDELDIDELEDEEDDYLDIEDEDLDEDIDEASYDELDADEFDDFEYDEYDTDDVEGDFEEEYEDDEYEDDETASAPSLLDRIKGFFNRSHATSAGEEDDSFQQEYDADYDIEYDGEFDEYGTDEDPYEEAYEDEEDDNVYTAQDEQPDEEDALDEEYYEDSDALTFEDDFVDAGLEFEDEAIYDEDEPEEPSEPLADPNVLHFDREEDADIVPRDTTGLDTISDSYDLYTEEVSHASARTRPEPLDDPSWGVSSYQPAQPVMNIARRAALFDLPDPSAESMDPFADDEYEDYEEEAVHEEYVESVYEDDVEPFDEPDADALEDVDYEDPNTTSEDDAANRQDTEEHTQTKFWGSSSSSDWKGGATSRADLRDDDDPIYIDAEDLQDAILEMGDEFLVAHDIWFVATGASEINHAGMHAFMDEHRRDIRGAFLVNLDSIGAGSLSVLVKEGLRSPRRADRRLVRMITGIAQDLHIQLETAVYGWDERESATSMRSRVRSVTIAGLDDNDLPALSHTPDDTPDNVDPQQVSNVVRIVTELIRRS